jgi:DNA replication and repair protein RecF
MRFTGLQLHQFRQFAAASWALHPRLNVVQGGNAAGKTTLLEALFFAARAESFRARRVLELIQDGQTSCAVSVETLESDASLPVGWKAQAEKGEVLLRRGHETVNRTTLTQSLPLMLIDHQQHRLFEDGPVYRRHYLDWGLFYVEPQFMIAWRRFERALRQRNTLLRQRAGMSEIQTWNPELVLWGERLHAMRAEHVKALRESLRPWLLCLLPDIEIHLTLNAGWDTRQGLAAALETQFESDRQAGFTHAGPQRAEIRVQWQSHLVRTHSSRGQQKLLALAMSLAQASLVHRSLGHAPVLLLDDSEAELSSAWQRRLFAALRDYPGQTVVSSLEWSAGVLPPQIAPDDYAMFHVEHGQVTPITAC